MTVLVLNLGCDRSAARTPSANKEPRYGLRYTSPAWASPSRDTMHARWGSVYQMYQCMGPLYGPIVDFFVPLCPPICAHLFQLSVLPGELTENILSDILYCHTVHIYKEYHSVCPLVGIGALPTPSFPSECATPTPNHRGEGTFACG
jgi:hypothetical protein